MTRARALGASTITLPTAGNAGNAAAAYAAAAGIRCEVFLPRDAKQPFLDECRLYGAGVTLVDGLITDAGRMAGEQAKLHDWYDVSTLKEPYRVEGKKTMGYELAEQFGWTLPDWIIYPTGGGTGMVGMWKAFDEMEALGWIGPKRPRMVTVQPTGCAPIVRAFDAGAERAPLWEAPDTLAHGLRVPKAIGDFLVLRAIRESGGTALAVTDPQMVDDMLGNRPPRGHLGGPGRRRGAVGRAGAGRPTGRIRPHETVVLFNTGGALKYLEVLHTVADRG